MALSPAACWDHGGRCWSEKRWFWIGSSKNPQPTGSRRTRKKPIASKKKAATIFTALPIMMMENCSWGAGYCRSRKSPLAPHPTLRRATAAGRPPSKPPRGGFAASQAQKARGHFPSRQADPADRGMAGPGGRHAKRARPKALPRCGFCARTQHVEFSNALSDYYVALPTVPS